MTAPSRPQATTPEVAMAWRERQTVRRATLLEGGVMVVLGAASRQVGILARGAGLVFLLEGLAASLFALNHRRIRSWGWGLRNGLGTLALGALLLLLPLGRLPWRLGILVGMSFLFSGLDLLLFSRRFHQDLTRDSA
ncbi:MAG: hypothetical protein VKP63_08765 [Cyanobacteriota bacterium]|nr:hypothetical protein [Cyanobacteriota bacterium]